ncbi:MAG: D-alanyl-D-alanine carboxypeptidase/D-alanyl-D-alanine-endopeptidase [Actinomycetota bacterium]
MFRARALLPLVLSLHAFLGVAPVPAAVAATPAAEVRRAPQPPAWTAKIDKLIGRRPFGVAVREGKRFLYRAHDVMQRIPASNEKLLMSMALLDTLGPESRILTQAASVPLVAGVIPGDLWILGQGDPDTGPAQMQKLAAAIQAAGVVQIEGSVNGSTGYFKRDWRAPGWKPYFPREEVALPTALTFEDNIAKGIHIRDPELRAARSLSDALKELGIKVGGKAGAGKPPEGLLPVAQVQSRRLLDILEFTNRYSVNFYAEVLGKRLGAERLGVPGSIAKGATAMREWAAEQGVHLRARDSSGLSYDNRLSPAGLVRLLGGAEAEAWGEAFRESLPRPGQGTLEGRMRHLQVRAKTGTLTGISALSGWVFLRREGVWAEFSILSKGMDKAQAMRIEDAVVRVLARSATL